MTSQDYISEVDALGAPASLRAKIGALPYGESPKRRRGATFPRWLAAAAVLALVVGLGTAMFRLFPNLFTGGQLEPPPVVTGAPAIPDVELTELMAARIPYARGDESYELLFSARQNGKTLGALRYSPGNLLFTVFNDETKEDVGLSKSLLGDQGELYTWINREMHVQLLCTNYAPDNGYGAALYDFYDGELSVVTQLPDTAGLPSSYINMLDPEMNAGFWSTHKAVINGTGLDIYRQGEASREDIWVYDYYVPLDASTGPTAAPLADEVLTELLAAQFPTGQPEDTWELLSKDSSSLGYTMGVLKYRWRSEQDIGLSILMLGAFNNASHQLEGQIYYFGGNMAEQYELFPYTTGGPDPGDSYFLCISESFGATPTSISYHAALYNFDGKSVNQVTTSPNAGLPEGMEDIFDTTKNEDFWGFAHKIILADSGFELFHRNFDYQRPDLEPQSLWLYDCYVPLTYKRPSTRVMEAARRYFEEYYTPGGSSDYPIEICEIVPNYEGWHYAQETLVYHIALGENALGERGIERYFVFDTDENLLDVRE